MLCAAEPGPLAPPQPWRGAEPFSLAAGVGVNGEKPHQGVASKKAAPHQRQTACNSTTALGLSWSWRSGTAPGARVTYDYDAWGNQVNTSGSTPNVYLYRGEQYDPDLGLYYLRARYFDPVTGRFLTRDPERGRIVTPEGLHKYLYAWADPVNRVDPLGRKAASEYTMLEKLFWAPVFAAAQTYAVAGQVFVSFAFVAYVNCIMIDATNVLVYAASGFKEGWAPTFLEQACHVVDLGAAAVMAYF
jgi:RHS repeat-associated protein